MYDPRLREEVKKSIKFLEKKISELARDPIHFPTDNYDLVLDIVETEDKLTNWQYYYVDHNTRTLFWLEPYEINQDVPGVKEPSHISKQILSNAPAHVTSLFNQETLLESHYWWGIYFILISDVDNAIYYTPIEGHTGHCILLATEGANFLMVHLKSYWEFC